MEIKTAYSLKPHNTFGIDAQTAYWADASSTEDIKEALDFSKDKKLLIIGGGSNMLLLNDWNGLTLHMGMRGIEKTGEDEEYIYITARAGENWHQFVMFCIDHNYAGLENLSLIPGSVGASPMQNIGAYGVEIRDVFYSLQALHKQDLSLHTFYKEDCEFDYRSSIFKTHAKDQYIITEVTYRLLKTPRLNTSYGAIGQELEKMGITSPTIRDVSNAVIHIRSSKLPDPAKIGNAGSFYKNPVISQAAFDRIKTEYADVVAYPQPNGEIKIAAGWLIEKAGWKGKNLGNYGVHAQQALVLVNYGGARGKDIYQLSEDIMQDIHEKFGIELEREVNMIF